MPEIRTPEELRAIVLDAVKGDFRIAADRSGPTFRAAMKSLNALAEWNPAPADSDEHLAANTDLRLRCLLFWLFLVDSRSMLKEVECRWIVEWVALLRDAKGEWTDEPCGQAISESRAIYSHVATAYPHVVESYREMYRRKQAVNRAVKLHTDPKQVAADFTVATSDDWNGDIGDGKDKYGQPLEPPTTEELFGVDGNLKTEVPVGMLA